MLQRPLALAATLALMFTLLGAVGAAAGPEGEPLNPLGDSGSGGGDGTVQGEGSPLDHVTVIAAIDSNFNPYHWDFLGSEMPQAQAGEPLPLDEGPDAWLPGFSTDGLASYESLDISLAENEHDLVQAKLAEDHALWESMPPSRAGEVHYRWLPGTKFIGAVDFGGQGFRGTNDGHGAKVASVSAGNYYGTCPECVVVGISFSGRENGEAAIDWAMSQPWIDVITNSYGFSLVSRDRLYSDSSTELQREASERGQTILFSAGNGQGNTFTAPNTTYFSSQEGPDWITTVGAVSPSSGGWFSGAGKTANIAAPGMSYPSIGGPTVTTQGTFSGTSNSTPVVAGFYGSALAWAREQLSSPRIQEGGVVAQGEPIACGEARPDCELGDGVLTAEQLRTRVLHAAEHTWQGPVVSVVDPPPPGVTDEELEYAAIGHGALFGRLDSDDVWAEEAARITGPMDGTAEPLERPDGEAEWMTVDSYCRQSIWGTWSGGYWDAETDNRPGPDPLWPLRSALEASCGELFPPV